MTTEEENFYMANINLAYKLAWKYYGKFKGYLDLDDLKQISLLGLVKAVKTFNQELNYTFTTYAYKVIKNEILMFNRSNQKWLKNISLNTPIQNIYDEAPLVLEDIITDDFNITDKADTSIKIDKLYKAIEKLKPRYKTIIDYRLQGLTMQEIGDILGISQAQVSRDYQYILSILRQKFNIMEEL